MEKEIQVGVHNRFDFVRRDAKTGEILGEYKAENIILNNFWGVYLSATGADDCLDYIHFGSGTATPVVTDVKLTTWLGFKVAPGPSDAGTIYDFSDYYSNGVVSVKKSVRLQDTEFNGSFISEVGFSASAAIDTEWMLTKALVKDMNGNVVSIEKKSGEVLDIFATFYVRFGSTDPSNDAYFGHPELNNTTFFKKILFMLDLPNTTQIRYLQGRPQPQHTSGNTSARDGYSTSQPNVTFDVANKKLIISVPNLTSSNGNIQGGIRGMYAGGILINLPCTGMTQPVLTKEVVGTGDGTKKDFQTAFGYIKDNGTCKVYINDVETLAAIDYEQMPARVNMANDMVILEYPKIHGLTTSLLGANSSAVSLPGSELIAENPWYATIPITTISYAYYGVYVSDDLENWSFVGERTSSSLATLTIPAEHQNKRYWKFVPNNNTSAQISAINTTATITNIHLASPPAVGDTIAVTYQPDCIAKDAQHVLNNVKVTVSFNEYTPT